CIKSDLKILFLIKKYFHKKIPNSFTLFKRFYFPFKDFSRINHLKITTIYAYKLFCHI
ncbi:hypothetical protein C1646_679437, partial [Rhizophagus diaphanus]